MSPTIAPARGSLVQTFTERVRTVILGRHATPPNRRFDDDSETIYPIAVPSVSSGTVALVSSDREWKSEFS